MLKFKEIPTTNLTLAEALCNWCGANMISILNTFDDQQLKGVAIEYTGGYNSYPLSDMVTYRFALCEECMAYMFGQFIIPVETEDNLMLQDPTNIPEIKPVSDQEITQEFFPVLPHGFDMENKNISKEPSTNDTFDNICATYLKE